MTKKEKLAKKEEERRLRAIQEANSLATYHRFND
jgi:hypothetical protein